MKKVLSLLITIISCLGLVINVSADTLITNATSSEDPNYNTLKSGFDKGIQTTNISTSEWVTLYGKSTCNGSTCTLEYAGQYSNFEDVLKRSVVCTNGETNITYQSGSSGKTQYAESNEAKFNGTVYWNEQYYVTCTKTSDGNSTIILENENNNNNNNSNNDNNLNNDSNNDNTNNNNNNNGTSNEDNTNNDEYNSATTVDPSETGVTTYFVVLSIVAIISYVVMMFIKKYNLFKSV